MGCIRWGVRETAVGYGNAEEGKGKSAALVANLSRLRRRSSPASSTEKRPRETRGGRCITGMMNDPQVA